MNPRVAVVLAGGAACLVAGFAFWLRAELRRGRALDRLAAPGPGRGVASVGIRSAVRERLVHVLVATVLGMSVGLFAWTSGAAPRELAFALGALASTLVMLVREARARARVVLVESQLAEALDMVVSALVAGATAADALDRAARESSRPLRPHLVDVVERLRLGESARSALLDFGRRLPGEGVRLFAFALSTHWDGGGSMAPSLAGVARVTRERVALARRVAAQAGEARASVFGVMAVTYALAWGMRGADPERMQSFIESDFGRWTLPSAVLLQLVGLLWMTRLTRVDA